jgi:hypothetical protein
MKRLAARAALAALVMGGFAQPLAAQMVRGRVIEHRTGYPVGLARVTVLDEAGQPVGYAQSNGWGEFTIRLQRAGRVFIRAELLGYRDAVSPMSDVGEGDEVYRVLSLRRGADVEGDGRGYGLQPRTILGPRRVGALTDTRPATSAAPTPAPAAADGPAPGEPADAAARGRRPAPRAGDSAKPRREGESARTLRPARPATRGGGTVRRPSP